MGKILENLGFRKLLALVLLVLPLTAFGQVSGEVAEELLKKNGLWDQLGELSAQAGSGFEESLQNDSSKMTPEERKRYTALFAEAYNVTRLRSVALRVVQAQLGPQQLAALRAWYDSTLGKDITAREIADEKTQDTQEQHVRRGMDALARASDHRRAQLNQAVRVTHAAETGAAVLIDSVIAIRQGVLEVDPGTPGPSVQELTDLLAKQRPRIEQRYGAITLASMALMYETLSDAELQRYVDFLSSPAGDEFNRVCVKAVGESMIDGAKEFGRLLKESGARTSA
jgi:hypothetical protein